MVIAEDTIMIATSLESSRSRQDILIGMVVDRFISKKKGKLRSIRFTFTLKTGARLPKTEVSFSCDDFCESHRLLVQNERLKILSFKILAVPMLKENLLQHNLRARLMEQVTVRRSCS